MTTKTEGLEAKPSRMFDVEVARVTRLCPSFVRFTFRGPDLRLSDKDAVSLGMVLHELCTNAVKHGALSSENGSVVLDWRVSDKGIELTWSELGGPTVAEPKKAGLGTRLLTRGLLQPPHGLVSLEFKPTGLVCQISIAAPVLDLLRDTQN